MVTSSDAFSIFLKFWFSGLLEGAGGVKRQKMAQNDKEILSNSVFSTSGIIPHMIMAFSTHV